MARLGRVHALRGWPQGKLAEAARNWVFALLDKSDPNKPLPMDEAMAAQFARLNVGIPLDDLAEETVIELWDINASVFGAFQALDTQWRYVAGLGGVMRTGLDYPSVEVVLRSRGLGIQELGLIQAMETAALAAFAEAGS